jgi:diadenosine tetraphosphate (Ap4A) HIT family hydrolase
MTTFKLNKQLEHDCHWMGKLKDCHLLLLDNALVPWFILVPESDITEFHELPDEQQLALLANINAISRFIQSEFIVTKLNTATIGNIVQQLHIHVIGRHEDDFCWPGVVWGRPEKQPYASEQVTHITQTLQAWFGDELLTSN